VHHAHLQSAGTERLPLGAWGGVSVVIFHCRTPRQKALSL
jgi:hypothetical protein